ncbi:hypothetical protein GCM10022248_05620 [Nonomuraea soli]
MRRSSLCPPGYRIGTQGVSTLPPGAVSHAGRTHVHEGPEIFVIVSGAGVAHIDGTASGFAAGDVLIVEAGEEHHLEAVTEVVTAWMHLEPA